MREAKISYCNAHIKRSTNKIKTAWNIIRENTGEIQNSHEIFAINLGTGIT
jgi:hypothetical protein